MCWWIQIYARASSFTSENAPQLHKLIFLAHQIQNKYQKQKKKVWLYKKYHLLKCMKKFALNTINFSYFKKQNLLPNTSENPGITMRTVTSKVSLKASTPKAVCVSTPFWVSIWKPDSIHNYWSQHLRPMSKAGIKAWKADCFVPLKAFTHIHGKKVPLTNKKHFIKKILTELFSSRSL